MKKRTINQFFQVMRMVADGHMIVERMLAWR